MAPPVRLAVLLALLLSCRVAWTQPSVVTPGEAFTLEVDGAPFYPLGWGLVGHCAALPAERYEARTDSLAAEFERMRTSGSNALFETPSSDGRYLPQQIEGGGYNWYGYTFKDYEGREQQRGHIRPGAYVGGLRRYMDLAYAGTDRDAEAPLYTLVSLAMYTVPEGVGRPYSGSDTLRCTEYRRFIEDERARHKTAGSDLAPFIPPVSCAPSDRLPFWEWNVRYIVQGLRDHPGLLGWYLWDEPAGATWRHLFGIQPSGVPPPPYTGPASLPTPDLLRHAYRRIIAFEGEGRAETYKRHPVVVDLYDVEAFFSNRFPWSREGALRPEYHSGPFDRAPEGGFHTPADVLGLEASAFSVETAARGGKPAHGWYWDPNIISRRAEMMWDAVERDDLWSGLVVAGQGWLAHGGPFGVPEPLRCPVNDRPRLKLLNDRDILWHLLTPQINGLRGQIYYARALNPYAGEGAEQVARIDRALSQFRAAELDRVFSAPRMEAGWTVERLTVEALTNYFRGDPDFVGTAEAYDPGRSAFPSPGLLPSPDAYRADTFSRSEAPDAYGHPALRSGVPTAFGAHRLLRTTLHHHGDALYLFVSNAYDARITAHLRFEGQSSSSVREGQFDLDAGGTFRWAPAPGRLHLNRSNGDAVLNLRLEPYEARIFRIGP